MASQIIERTNEDKNVDDGRRRRGGGGGSGGGYGDPAPLGLCGFALTTFVLSCYNAGIFGIEVTSAVNVAVGAAVFYGGVAQAAAGMWELASGNTFGATAFVSYGAFWLSYAALLIPWFGVSDAYAASRDPSDVRRAIAIFLLSWTIFTLLMLLASFRTTSALVLLFASLSTTFLLLTVAEYTSSSRVKRAAGFFGIFTAAVAWYAALAALLASQHPPLLRLPVGRLHHTTNNRTT